jgi:DNA-binding MarR family transcriptional regulator
MKVDKVLSRFATAPEDPKELRRVARALGNELPRQRPEVLRCFRAGLARQPVTAGSHAEGYIAGLLDVAAEYEVSLRQAADQADIRRRALRKDWREVLVLLADGPRQPSDLAARVGKDRATLTRILKKLRAAGLVQVYASNELDGRTRPHRLTLLGQRIVEGRDTGISADVERGVALDLRYKD